MDRASDREIDNDRYSNRQIIEIWRYRDIAVDRYSDRYCYGYKDREMIELDVDRDR